MVFFRRKGRNSDRSNTQVTTFQEIFVQMGLRQNVCNRHVLNRDLFTLITSSIVCRVKRPHEFGFGLKLILYFGYYFFSLNKSMLAQTHGTWSYLGILTPEIRLMRLKKCRVIASGNTLFLPSLFLPAKCRENKVVKNF